jgi:hypothetical protein
MSVSYTELADEVGRLVAAKAKAYGRSTATAGDVLGLLWPCGIPVDAYEDALSIARILEKAMRLVHGRGTFGESEWLDICGHALVALARDRADKERG